MNATIASGQVPVCEQQQYDTSIDPNRILAHYPSSLDAHYLELVAIHGWRSRKTESKTLTVKGVRRELGGREVQLISHRYRTISTLRDDPSELRGYVEELALKGYQVYWRRCTTYRVNPKKFSKKRDMRTCPSFILEIDHCDPQEALAAILAAGLPHPSFAITSGNGVHVYWNLAVPICARTAEILLPQFMSRAQCLMPEFDIDELCKDTPRLLRLPGSINFKRYAKALNEHEIHDVALIRDSDIATIIVDRPDLRYSISSLLPRIDDQTLQSQNAINVLLQNHRHKLRTRQVLRDKQESKRSKSQKNGMAAGACTAHTQMSDSRKNASPSSPPSCIADPLESEHRYDPYKTGRDVLVPLAVRSVERVTDPDFISHIKSVAARCRKPVAGHRNNAIAEFAARMRQSYSGQSALTEREAVFSHDVWFRPYEGSTPIEVSRSEFLYAYTTMACGKSKGDWIEEMKQEMLAHPLRGRIKGRADGVATAQRLADIMFTACMRQDEQGRVEHGRVAMAHRTAMEVLGVAKGTASRALAKLEADGLVKCVYLGNRATGLGSEYVCLDASGDVIEPAVAQEPPAAPEAGRSTDSRGDVAGMEVGLTAHPEAPEGQVGLALRMLEERWAAEDASSAGGRARLATDCQSSTTTRSGWTDGVSSSRAETALGTPPLWTGSSLRSPVDSPGFAVPELRPFAMTAVCTTSTGQTAHRSLSRCMRPTSPRRSIS